MHSLSLSSLGATLLPRKWRGAYRTAKVVATNRLRHFEVPAEPHFDADSTAYFLERLRSTRTYLEYGSGGSTILANKLVETVVSVDSDARFLAEVDRKLETDGRRANVELIHVNIGLTVDWGIPVFTKPTRRRVQRWEEYAAAPWRYFRKIARQPDLILVDGRFRVACVLESLLSLSPESPTQILLDDYVGRPHYEVVAQFADVELAGRMAILRPRRLVDRVHVRRLVKQYSADYR